MKSGQTEPLFGSFNGTSSDSKVNIKNLNLEVKNTNKLNCALAMYAGTKGRITMSNVCLLYTSYRIIFYLFYLTSSTEI